MIGIGITTRNRKKYCTVTHNAIIKFLPNGAKLVIVDDASEDPYPRATFRFNENVGPAVAKNKCLDLLKECEHIFLFDDDCYPIRDKWWEPYVESPSPHLCFSFTYKYKNVGDHRVYDLPNGCMMYIHKKCLEAVGGFDPGFIKYGYWHANYSTRVYNAGLNYAPFMDVEGSHKLIKSLDKEGRISSVTPNQKDYVPDNRQRYFDKINSKEYIEFRTFDNHDRIWYLTPFALDMNIGREYNNQISIIPDNDWICIRDGDTCFTTPDSKWGIQINDIVNKYKDYSLIGCMTNRLGIRDQLYGGEISDNPDWSYHKEIGEKLYKEKYDSIKDVKSIAGLFMLFPKKVWLQNKFRETEPYRIFDTDFCKDIIKNKGKIGIAEGIYLFHDYRWGKKNPKRNTKHLL